MIFPGAPLLSIIQPASEGPAQWRRYRCSGGRAIVGPVIQVHGKYLGSFLALLHFPYPMAVLMRLTKLLLHCEPQASSSGKSDREWHQGFKEKTRVRRVGHIWAPSPPPWTNKREAKIQPPSWATLFPNVVLYNQSWTKAAS